MKVYATFRSGFNAGHRLHNPALDDEANRRLYGKCNNPHGHGHNYFVEVTLAGAVNPETGRFVDLDAAQSWFEDSIVSQVDHRNLNIDVPFMTGIIPTAENIAMAVFELIGKGPYGVYLHQVRLSESENNAATVTADGAA